MAGPWEDYQKDTAPWEDYQPTTTTKQPLLQTPLSQKGLGDPTLNLLASAGLVSAVPPIGKYLYQPEVRKQRAGLKQELGGMQKQLGIEGTEPTFIPKKISQNIEDVAFRRNQAVGQLDNFTKQTTQSLKNQLNILDDTLISLNAEDLAKTVKSNYKDWLNSAYESYRVGRSAAGEFYNQFGGKPLDNQVIATEILDKANNRLPMPDARIQALRESLTPVDIENNFIQRPMSFEEVDQLVNNIVRENPTSNASHAVSKEWSNFIKSNGPKEVSEYMSNLDSKYSTFAQAREKLSSLIDRSTGEFDHKGMIKYLIDHTKRGYDEGTVNLMKMLGEASDLLEPIKGVKEKFGALSQLRQKRAEVKGKIGETALSSRERLSEIEKMADEEISKMKGLKNKSQELLSKAAVVEEKLASRNPAKIIAKMFGRKVVPFLGVAPQLLDALTYAKDPSLYSAVQETGLGEEQLKGIRDSYNRFKAGTHTKEDEDLLIGSGLIG